MGKGDRRAKPLPVLAAVKPLLKRGRQRMAEINHEAAVVGLSARVARGAPDMDAARNPLYGSDIGRCMMYILSGDDLRNASDVWGSLSSAWSNYCTRILGLTPGPQCSTFTMTPEPMQTDPSARVDIRTPEEKDIAAKRAWDAWCARVDAISTPGHKWAVRGTLHGFTGDGALWHDRAPTAGGRMAVAGLMLLVDT